MENALNQLGKNIFGVLLFGVEYAFNFGHKLFIERCRSDCIGFTLRNPRALGKNP